MAPSTRPSPMRAWDSHEGNQGGMPVAEAQSPTAAGMGAEEDITASGDAESTIGSRRDALKANTVAQAGALFRRSVILQKRLPRTTACLIISPFFFCALVFGFQLLLDTLWLGRPEYQCGCQCTQCCFFSDEDLENGLGEGDPPCYTGEEALEVCTPANRIEILSECKARDETKCGVEYSVPAQLYWCGIQHPVDQPPFVPVPEEEFRAQSYRGSQNATAVLYTGSDPDVAQAMADKLVPGSSVVEILKAMETTGIIMAAGLQQQGTQTDMSSLLEMIRELDPASLSGGNPSPDLDGLVDAVGTEALLQVIKALNSAPRGIIDSLVALSDESSRGASSDMNLLMNWLVTSSILGTTADPQGSYYSDPAMNRQKLLLANANTSQCINDIPAPFNSPPFDVGCLPVEMVLKPSAKDINDALFCGWFSGPNWMECPNSAQNVSEYASAYDFMDTSIENGLKVGVWYNDSFYVDPPIGSQPNHRMWQSMNMVSNAFLKYSMGDDSLSSSIISVKEMPKLPSRLQLDFASTLGSTFYMIVVQLIFPVILQQLVYEKHHKLRIMMRMHGLSDAVYWAVSYLWYMGLSIVYFALLLIFGSAIDLKFFTLTDPGVLVAFFFLFGNVQIAMAFLLSTLIQNPKAASGVGYGYVFGVTFGGSFLLQNLVQQNSPAVLYLEIVPANALFRAMYEISEYAFRASYQGTTGMSFSSFSDEGNGMQDVFIIFLIEFPLFMVLAWYFEQIFGQVGARKHPLFFLPFLHSKANKVSPDMATVDAEDVKVGVEGEDVAAERRRVTSMTSYQGQSIVLKDLKKVYPAQGGKGPKNACRALTMAVERGECFGLLGPNGAGKSTSINMMVGFLTPTSGNIMIEGLDIGVDLDHIYPLMGVCPQHDLLWESMTGREHLLFYGRLKNLKGEALRQAVEKALKSVNLFSNKVGDKQVGKYSGGMKRRLSVAISLIGDPLVVYLDEPSTGLDPASRRNLWDVIKQGKQGRAIILTTHSMEEAEVLCDRLGIFVDGALQVIGNPKELSKRYGGYLQFTITTSLADVDAARDAVMNMCPGAQATYCLAGTQKFQLPTSDVTVATVFKKMGNIKEQVGVLDWAVSNSSLEDVFIDIAKKGQGNTIGGD